MMNPFTATTTLLAATVSLLAGPAQALQTPDAPTRLKQFTSRGHVLGFDEGGYYVSNGTYALRVSFDKAAVVAPSSDDYRGGDSAAEQQAAPLSRVSYSGLWNGISVVYDAPRSGIARSTWTLQPGADHAALRLRYNRAVYLTESGELGITFGTGAMVESHPIAWQDVDGQRQPVEVAFVQLEDDVVGFRVGRYRVDLPLTIDPTLTWNTFLGGSGLDAGGGGIAVDGSGNVYVAGTSGATWGSPVRAHAGGVYDGFVAKLTSAGALVWNTFLGGSGLDQCGGIAIDGSGNVYVGGFSDVTWGSPVRAFTSGFEGYAAKLTTAGALVWNTFLGGSGYDNSGGIAIDGSGNVYVAGASAATWGSPVRAFTSGIDGFAARLTSAGALVWNTFLGGVGTDQSWPIAVDGSGNVYVAGTSAATWGSPVRAYTSGVEDGFAARLTSAGALVWNTFLGGSGDDFSTRIAVDGNGNVYVAGASDATWGSPVRAYGGGDDDGFAAKLSSAGALVWNTFLGGSGNDSSLGIAVDGGGNVYVAGGSDATWGSPVRAYGGGVQDGFAAKLTSAGAVFWSTFLGGSGSDQGSPIAVDGSGNVYVAGISDATWGSPVRTYTSGSDAFVVQLEDSDPPQTPTNTMIGAPTATPTATPATDCSAVPEMGCRTAQRSFLLLKQSGGSKDKLTWKWLKGQPTGQGELSDPTATASYDLCVYDTTGMLFGARIPPDSEKWSVLGNKGYVYRDANGSKDGITKVLLKGSMGNRAKALVKGKGNNLPDPTLGNLPLPVTVQLHNHQTGVCFEAVYESTAVIINESDLFVGKSP